MHPFEYHRPQSLSEAAQIFSASAEPRWLAGGMTLLPVMKLRLAAPSDLIDLSAIDALRGISIGEQRSLVIGAMTTHAQVAESSMVRGHLPVLSALAEGIGDTQVRHRGTLGGSIANNDPAADYPAAVLGLGATVLTSARRIAADDFVVGMFETALQPEEVVTAVSFPIPDAAAYVKFPNPASRYAIVGVMVARTGSEVRVAATGAGACAMRLPVIEQALTAHFSPDALRGIELAADGLNDDLHGSAEYRAHLLAVMARRAVAAALEGSAR